MKLLPKSEGVMFTVPALWITGQCAVRMVLPTAINARLKQLTGK